MQHAETAEFIDKHVGERLRQRRAMLGLTQTQLAERLNLTYQQLQKYEKGHNRVAASRLFVLSKLLGVEVSYFYEGLDDAPGGAFSRELFAHEDEDSKRELLYLSRAFRQIQDPKLRKTILAFITSFGEKTGT